MTIYIDINHKCHVTDNGTRRAFDVPFFDGKCDEFVAGYQYVPPGERMIMPNGSFFWGEMITPWRDYRELAEIQAAADRVQAQADKEIGILLDTIEELIIGG